jgi:hypothetical protein
MPRGFVQTTAKYEAAFYDDSSLLELAFEGDFSHYKKVVQKMTMPGFGSWPADLGSWVASGDLDVCCVQTVDDHHISDVSYIYA